MPVYSIESWRARYIDVTWMWIGLLDSLAKLELVQITMHAFCPED